MHRIRSIFCKNILLILSPGNLVFDFATAPGNLYIELATALYYNDSNFSVKKLKDT
jgi:hypothetical protein